MKWRRGKKHLHFQYLYLITSFTIYFHKDRSTLGGNGWAFIPLSHSVTGRRLPLEEHNLGQSGSLQIRQMLKELTAGDCLLTSLPSVGQHVLP